MFVYLSFYTLYYCIYIPKIVKKLRIHQSYSLNPHFYIRSIHSPIKNTPKHQVYTLAKRFKTFIYAILLFRRHFSPPWLEPPNPQKQRSYRLFQSFSLVIRAIHSTWHESCLCIIIPGTRASTLRKRTWILFLTRRGTCQPYFTVTGTCRETGSYLTDCHSSLERHVMCSVRRTPSMAQGTL